METQKKLLSPNSCAQCGALYTVPKGEILFCRDCKAWTQGGEVVKSGDLDLHYSLDVQNGANRTVWIDSVYVLFQSQCMVAHGLKISPGSSFTNWLKSRENAEGKIDDPESLQTLLKIARKILKYRQYIDDPYLVETITALEAALPKAARMILTFKKR